MNAIDLLLSALADYARARRYNDIAEYIDLVRVTRQAVGDDKEKLGAITAEIRAMIDENRGPTAEQKQSVRDRRHELSQQIQSIDTGQTTSTSPTPATNAAPPVSAPTDGSG